MNQFRKLSFGRFPVSLSYRILNAMEKHHTEHKIYLNAGTNYKVFHKYIKKLIDNGYVDKYIYYSNGKSKVKRNGYAITNKGLSVLSHLRLSHKIVGDMLS